MSGVYINKDGTLAISVEKNGDTTITIDYFGPEQKRSETRTVGGTDISIERWHEDGTIRKKLFDWEKEKSYPLLTEDDESTRTPGLFLVGPQVRHDNLIFCFIYKYFI